MKKIALLMIAVTVMAFAFAGCANTANVPDPDKIVPARDVLIENLAAKGYSIETLSAVEGSDLTVERVIARNGNKFIDIVYGLSSYDAAEIFELYRGMYPDGYYILARNGNYVYCVSDKGTFSKAGFKSMDNIGSQFING